jgi:hypothetical protein
VELYKILNSNYTIYISNNKSYNTVCKKCDNPKAPVDVSNVPEPYRNEFKKLIKELREFEFFIIHCKEYKEYSLFSKLQVFGF